MCTIKIFVSHRIDINSELIKNPLYFPVRCGATFDQENLMNIQGDDTGEHISEKRMSFCEFTVQYWAWKNIDSDYYGLCHYRRYLAFSDKKYFPTNEYNMVHCSCLTPYYKKKFNLLNDTYMSTMIEKNDIIVSKVADVTKIPLPSGSVSTVQELWDAHDNIFFNKCVITMMFEEIEEKSPEYLESAKEYFSGKAHRGFNCYVMKRELFDRLCSFQFPILKSIESRLDTTGYSQTMLRTPAFVGEMLYGIFLHHVTIHETWKVKEVQLVFFSDTEKIKGSADLFFRGYFWKTVDSGLRCLVDPIFPKGSHGREVIKNILYKFTPLVKRGVADIKEDNVK